MTKTAIILFAEAHNKEADKKRFVSSSSSVNRQISRTLTSYFYQLAKEVHPDVFLISSLDQRGNSFGERLGNAFNDLYDRGFENVVCIGNDTTALTSRHLADAIAMVEEGRIALGPSRDQGAYLIGLPKDAFSRTKFINIRWQSRYTLLDLQHYCRFYQDSVVTFEVFSDWDNPLAMFYALNPKNKLTKIIQEFIAYISLRNQYFSPQVIAQDRENKFPRRGPPMAAFQARN